jgi:3-oxoadipate enol-lactonase
VPNKYVQVEGIATFLHYRGPTTLPDLPPDTRQGRTVVCLHDAGDNGAVFAALLDGLADTHSPLAFDQPGHARSGSLDSLGAVSRIADFSAAVCDKLGLGAALMVGQGLGAAVAVELAAVRPDRVAALVLCGVGSWNVEEARLDQLRRVTEGKARREFDSSGYAATSDRSVYSRAFGEWMKTDPRALYGDLLALDAWDRGAARGLATPALLLVGDAETPAAVATAEAVAGEMASARIVRVTGSGHRIPLEQPEALVREVAAFLGASQP